MWVALSAVLLAAAPPAPDAGPPRDFIDVVKPLYDVLACASDRGSADGGVVDAAALEAYCKTQRPRYEQYRKHWGTKAKDFIAGLRPADLPATVVYPFGGGDVLSALTTYPDAKEITTLSLEQCGDPRRLPKLKDAKVARASLELIAETIKSTLLSSDSKSVNMSKAQKGELPGQLSMHLIGLAVQGYEPRRVHFFRLEPDGSVHYLSDPEVAALEPVKAQRLKESWASPDFSPAFANVEIAFAPVGSPPNAPVRVHRHIAANLADDEVGKHLELFKYLDARGKVAAMTKAASYLLWRPDFSKIRDWLLGHTDFMISDSTGVPPSYAKKAGFELETYGAFERSFLGAAKDINEEYVKLFASQPRRALPFRYGYADGGGKLLSHLIVMKRAKADAGTR